MIKEQAKQFCDQWLPVWTGNQPEKLASFYSEDVVYADPAIFPGLKGKTALLDYFKKLLAHNPNWIWTHLEAFPMEDGFLNKWLACIPAGGRVIQCIGVCTVQFDKTGLIRRNEVYFDRSELLAAMKKPD